MDGALAQQIEQGGHVRLGQGPFTAACYDHQWIPVAERIPGPHKDRLGRARRAGLKPLMPPPLRLGRAEQLGADSPTDKGARRDFRPRPASRTSRAWEESFFSWMRM